MADFADDPRAIVRTETGSWNGTYNDEICSRCNQRYGKHAVPMVSHYGSYHGPVYCSASDSDSRTFNGSGTYVRVEAADLL